MKKLLITILIVLSFVFAAKTSARMIGDIETLNLTPDTRIEFIDNDEPEQSVAFRYSDVIKVVIMDASFCPIHRIFELDSLRYLKDGKLHYYAFNTETRGYVLTEASADVKEYWIRQLKEYMGGI